VRKRKRHSLQVPHSSFRPARKGGRGRRKKMAGHSGSFDHLGGRKGEEGKVSAMVSEILGSV